jgi:hypothetical protein
VAVGVFEIFKLDKTQRLRPFVVVFLVLVYFYSVGRYFVQYTYDWKTHNASYFAKGTTDALNFIDNNKNKYEKIFLVGFEKNTFLHYAFTHKLPIGEIQTIMRNNNTSYGNISFIGECLGGENGDPSQFIKENQLYIAPVNCHKKAQKKGIIKNSTGKDVIYGIY